MNNFCEVIKIAQDKGIRVGQFIDTLKWFFEVETGATLFYVEDNLLADYASTVIPKLLGNNQASVEPDTTVEPPPFDEVSNGGGLEESTEGAKETPAPAAEAPQKTRKTRKKKTQSAPTESAKVAPVATAMTQLRRLADPVQVKSSWDALTDSEKIAAKTRFKTTSNWYKCCPKIPEGKAPAQGSDWGTETERVYGEDARNQIAFSQLSNAEKKTILSKWKDSYAWYLCEKTNIVAVGLREGYDASQIARQYGLHLEEVQQCKPLPA